METNHTYVFSDEPSFWTKLKGRLIKALPYIGGFAVTGGAAVGGYYLGKNHGFEEGYEKCCVDIADAENSDRVIYEN